MKTFHDIKKSRKRRGAALVEYGLIIAGVALVSAAAVSIFGKKTSDMIGSAAAVLPGAQASDNGPIRSGRLIETTDVSTSPDGVIEIDGGAIAGNTNSTRLGDNLGISLEGLVVDGEQP